MFEYLNFIFTDYTLRTVILGTAMLGMVSGALGCFAYLKRQSFLGDAIAHAALPGIAAAYIISGNKSTAVLLIGALIASWFGMLLVMNIIRFTRVKEDGALGIILSVFFGFGMVLLTYISRMPSAGKAGLNKFLFGMSATMLESDVMIMASMGILALILMIVFWKEFKLLSFDREFGATIGLPMRKLELFLIALIVTAIIIGLEAVGVVLMSTMIVTPATAARQWTDRLWSMVLLAALFGAVSGIMGALISGIVDNLPTGPTIVLFVSGIFVISALISPKHGILFRLYNHYRKYQQIRFETVLLNMHELALNHPEHIQHGHSTRVLNTMSYGDTGVKRSLILMHLLGYVKKNENKTWSLTEKGLNEAKKVTVRRFPDGY